MDYFSLVNNFILWIVRIVVVCLLSSQVLFDRHQRYRCKQCQKNDTVQLCSTDYSPESKQIVQEMYLGGLGFRVIGRLLKVSHTAVYDWIKKAGQTVALEQENESSIDVVEIDEMHTFVGQKK